MNDNTTTIKNYNGICISSGGVYGSYMLGILHYIFNKVDTNKIKYFAGTSVGSIICLMLIIGYTPIEILTYICSQDISKIFVFNMSNIVENFGIYNIDNLRIYLENMILKKLKVIPTFKELYNMYNRYFICCCYCITTKSKVYFSHTTTPDTSVLEAIVRSSSIPFILTKCKEENNIYVDGAVFDHFPIIKLIHKMSLDLDLKNIRVLGINIHSKKFNNISSYNDYVSSILNIFIDIQNKDEDSEYLKSLINKKIVDIIDFDKEMCFNLIDNVKRRIENFCEGINVAKLHYSNKKIKTD